MKTSLEKPNEILELELICDIVFNEEKESSFLADRINRSLRNFFVRNRNGEIIALGINELSLKSEDLKHIKGLNNLIFLSLTTNSITDISDIFPKPKLKYLYLGSNKITNITPIAQSLLLEELAIWFNPIEDLTSLSALTNLRELYCQRAAIKSLDFIRSLNHLEIINISYNEISDISILAEMTDLKEVDLTNNNIKIIPKQVAESFGWLSQRRVNANKSLRLSRNPLEYPPNSVLQLGQESIKNYYEASESFGYEPLSEGRIIVVGDGSAGKSSLIERVLHNSFAQGKTQTNGIFIEQWELTHLDSRNLTFHIWDFGGQEIQHAVHKFFFTEGCLYVLVLDNRKEEEPEYWLQQIESLGGNAPVLLVFNKQDENITEIADRKFLKEKYPNIIGFYNTSCKTGFGVDEFKDDLAKNVIKLQTVDEQFPNNWFNIKKAIKECTSGEQHYLDYKSYSEICKSNNVNSEEIQKLLLKYFTTIGAITWFGDTYLNFLHVLSPKWITQGVYKIITSKKTAELLGVININHFKELLYPSSENDYIYEEAHYGYILSMMKKFDLCYSPDDKSILIPSAFGKVPKVEYSEFRGEEVRTYILQFKDYMPLALIHRFTAKKLPNAHNNNYWYSGIVINDNKSESLAMIHADKEAKRIYVRIKGKEKLGLWEHIRRELHDITSNYASISYNELISLDNKSENTVSYEDLISHISANKSIYFHPKLQRDFNVGYLIGMFESKEQTIEKFKNEVFDIEYNDFQTEKIPPLIINILNNNSPTVNAQINTEINIDIDINVVNNISSTIKGEADYLLEALEENNELLKDALNKVIQFANDSKSARNSGDVIEKGWSRKLKSVIKLLSNAGEQFKNIEDGSLALKSMMNGLYNLVSQFNLNEVKAMLEVII